MPQGVHDALLSFLVLCAPPLAILPLWASPHTRDTKIAVTVVATTWMILASLVILVLATNV